MDRLQKVLAHAGVASRRKCEELITSGKVTVDGQIVTELGTKVDPRKQTILVEGQPIETERKLCFLLHKPTSYVTTVTDPEGRRTVMDLLEGIRERLYPVGRLDYDSSGLLLLSNDGELTNRLLHPSKLMDKVYRVTIVGMPEKEQIKKLELGVRLEDGVTKPAKVFALKLHPMESVLEITIHEGKNRQIRRMCEAIGFPVKRLKRVQFGPIELGNLPPSRWRVLNPDEWKALYDAAELPCPPYPFAEEKVADKRALRRTQRGKRPSQYAYSATAVAESPSTGQKGRIGKGQGRVSTSRGTTERRTGSQRNAERPRASSSTRDGFKSHQEPGGKKEFQKTGGRRRPVR